MDQAMQMLLDSIINKLEVQSKLTHKIGEKVSEIEKSLAVITEKNRTHANHCPINEGKVKEVVKEVLHQDDYDNLTKKPKKTRAIIMWVVVVILSLSQIYNIFFHGND